MLRHLMNRASIAVVLLSITLAQCASKRHRRVGNPQNGICLSRKHEKHWQAGLKTWR